MNIEWLHIIWKIPWCHTSKKAWSQLLDEDFVYPLYTGWPIANYLLNSLIFFSYYMTSHYQVRRDWLKGLVDSTEIWVSDFCFPRKSVIYIFSHFWVVFFKKLQKQTKISSKTPYIVTLLLSRDTRASKENKHKSILFWQFLVK